MKTMQSGKHVLLHMTFDDSSSARILSPHVESGNVVDYVRGRGYGYPLEYLFMYNLIMTGATGAWEAKRYEFPRERMLEYTDPILVQRYKALDEQSIAALKSFPALFAYEKDIALPARIGKVTRILPGVLAVRFEFEFLSEIPSIEPSALKSLSWEFDIEVGRGELNRSHWAVKNVDLSAVLIEAGLIEPASILPLARPSGSASLGAMTINPMVFNVSDQVIEPNLVSVMMPFGAEFDEVYLAIQEACRMAGMRSQRAADIWEDSTIIQDIFNLLRRSSVVVVDFSGWNANVMYETGIAHVLGRPVVPISQSVRDVPFNLRQHRVLEYLRNTEGLAAMKDSLAERLKTLRARM